MFFTIFSKIARVFMKYTNFYQKPILIFSLFNELFILNNYLIQISKYMFTACYTMIEQTQLNVIYLTAKRQ